MTTNRAMLCHHCGNETAFELCGECTFDESVEYKGYPFLDDITTWKLFQCISCSNVTLQHIHKIVDYNDYDYDDKGRIIYGRSYEEKILYPSVSTALTYLPEPIRKKYEEALRVRAFSPDSFAVLAGKTLEAVCDHEKALGKTLTDRINHLVNSNRLPTPLAEMANHIRQFRNIGAHFNKEEVTEDDVLIIVDFLEAVLEYLYVAPAKIEAVKKRLNK